MPDERRTPLQWARLAAVVVLALAVAVGVALVIDPRLRPDAVFGAADPAPATATTAADPQPASPGSPSEEPEPAPVPTRAAADLVLAALTDAGSPTPALVAARLQPLLAGPALGPQIGLAVVDPRSGEVLAERDADSARMPASTTKVLTGVAALEAVGADTRFRTVVSRGGGQGEVVLVGGGDPALSARTATDARWPYAITRLDQLAAATATALLAEGVGEVRLTYTDAVFGGPAVNPAWEPGYVQTGEVAPVSALSLDGGRATPGVATRVDDPAQAAADRFAALLAAAGVRVAGPVTGGGQPGGEVLATATSPTVAELVHQMLQRSDNDVAEALLRHVARAEGLPATSVGGTQAVRVVLQRLGVATDGLALVDGSGLARSNRISPTTLVETLAVAYVSTDPALRAAVTGLPVAGFTGSLLNRFDADASEPQAGDVRAKTGFLTGVVSLAGVVVDDDGEPMVFALIADGVPRPATAAAQAGADELAALLAGCGCG